MKRFLVLGLTLVMAGCVTQRPEQPSQIPQASTARSAAKGQETAERLTQRYHSTLADCGAPSRPAFLCTGIVFRGTKPSPNYHAWNPSPYSVTSGGVSFSYLRADSKYGKIALGYSNGFIFRPYLSAEENVHPEVLCAFPIDGWTDNRAEKGCGAYSGLPDSGPCQHQGITTAQRWHEHYIRVVPDFRPRSQCGFDVRDALHDQAAAFRETIAAMRLISTESFGMQNELRIATWAQDIPNQLPIEAFFYVDNGLSGAQLDQRDFFHSTGTAIPIIRMTLPATTANDATFEYRTQDQVEFRDKLAIDTSHLMLSGLSIKAVWPRIRDSSGNIAQRLASGGQPPFTYQSSHPNIASVTARGKVVGERNGTATITVSDATGASVSYPVTVSNVFLLAVNTHAFASVHAAGAWVVSQGGHSVGLAGAEDLKNSFGLPFPIGIDEYWFMTPGGCPGGMSLYYSGRSAGYGCGNDNTSGLGALYMVRY